MNNYKQFDEEFLEKITESEVESYKTLFKSFLEELEAIKRRRGTYSDEKYRREKAYWEKAFHEFIDAFRTARKRTRCLVTLEDIQSEKPNLWTQILLNAFRKKIDRTASPLVMGSPAPGQQLLILFVLAAQREDEFVMVDSKLAVESLITLQQFLIVGRRAA